jgi:hypothetical protein
MKKYLLPLLAVTLLVFNACKKDNPSTKDQYSKLITGSWHAKQQHIKVFDLSSNELLKDSTIDFDGEFADRAWTEVYNSNGNTFTITYSRKIGAAVATADTSSYATYAILGTNLTLKQNIGGTQTKPILKLNATNMELQYTYTGALNQGWLLTPGVTYKIAQTTYYNRL